ncbi:MAG: hypothetical protein AAFX93_14200 [Verrucomicrobiota bacterium]
MNNDSQFSAEPDPLKRAELLDQSFRQAFSSDSQVVAYYQSLDDQGKGQYVSHLSEQFKAKHADAFQVELEPARTETRQMQGRLMSGTSIEVTVPAKTRPLLNIEAERFIQALPNLDPSSLDDETFVQTIPAVRGFAAQGVISDEVSERWRRQGEHRIETRNDKLREQHGKEVTRFVGPLGEPETKVVLPSGIGARDSIEGTAANAGGSGFLEPFARIGRKIVSDLDSLTPTPDPVADFANSAKPLREDVDPLERAVRGEVIDDFNSLGALSNALALTVFGSGPVAAARNLTVPQRVGAFAGVDVAASIPSAPDLPGFTTEALGVDRESLLGQTLTVGENVALGALINTFQEVSAARRAKQQLADMNREQAIEFLAEELEQPNSAIAEALAQGEQLSTTRSGNQALDELTDLKALVSGDEAAQVRLAAKEEFAERVELGRQQAAAAAEQARISERAAKERIAEQTEAAAKEIPDPEPEITQLSEDRLTAMAEEGNAAAANEIERRALEGDLFDPAEELQAVIKELGGLPTSKNLREIGDPLAGDVATFEQSVNRGQRMRLFNAEARQLDDLRLGLEERGFSFQTVDDLFVALDDSLRGVRRFPDFGNHADFAAAPKSNDPGSSGDGGNGLSSQSKRFVQDFFNRLRNANAEKFDALQLDFLDDQQWSRFARRNPIMNDTNAVYAFGAGRILFKASDEALKGDGVVDFLVHESGHFAHDFILGDDFVREQWVKLSPEKRQQAWKAYAGQSAPSVDDNLLINDPTARREWAAMQFARVVRGESEQLISEGVDRGLVDKLQAWFEEIRQIVSQFIGDANLTTDELDRVIIDRLRYADPEALPSDALVKKERGAFTSQKKHETLSKVAQGHTTASEQQFFTPIPNKVTIAEAREIIERDGIEKTKQRVLSPQSNLQPRQRAVLTEALVNYYDRAYQAALRAGDPAAQQLLDEFITLESAYVQLGTQLAQGLQAFSLKGLNLVPEKWVRQYRKLLEEAQEAHKASRGPAPKPKDDGTPGSFDFDESVAAEIERRAQEARETPEGFARAEKLNDLRKFIASQVPAGRGDLFISLAYASVLSGPQTQLINFSSTSLQGLSDAMSASITNPAALRDIWVGYYQGLARGLNDAVGVLGKGIQYKGQFQKLSDIPPILESHVFVGGPWNPLNYAKFVGRTMGASDMLFFRASEQSRSRVLARQIAKEEGLAGNALSRRVNQIMGTTTEAQQSAASQASREGFTGIEQRRRIAEILEQARPEDLRRSAQNFALRSTYNQEPEGYLGIIAKAMARLTEQIPLLKLVVPFTRVVANVSNRLIDYSPIGFARAFVNRKELLDEGTDVFQQQLAQAFMGTTAMGLLAWRTAEYIDHEDPPFMVTGKGTNNLSRDRQLAAAGWRPYALKLGDRYISYKETPFAMPLAIVGNYFDAVRYRELSQEAAADRAAYALSQLPRVILDQSFLTGIRDLFEGLSRDPLTQEKGWTERLAGNARSILIPNLVRQIDKIFDPKVYTDDSIQEFLIRDIPIVRSLHGKPILNSLGEPIRANWELSERVLPRFTTLEKSDPVWRAITEHDAWLPDYRTTATLHEIVDGQLEKRDMTPDEYYSYVQRRGELTREMLEPIVSRFNEMPKEAVQDTIQSISNAAGEQARSELQNAVGWRQSDD